MKSACLGCASEAAQVQTFHVVLADRTYSLVETAALVFAYHLMSPCRRRTLAAHHRCGWGAISTTHRQLCACGIATNSEGTQEGAGTTSTDHSGSYKAGGSSSIGSGSCYSAHAPPTVRFTHVASWTLPVCRSACNHDVVSPQQHCRSVSTLCVHCLLCIWSHACSQVLDHHNTPTNHCWTVCSTLNLTTATESPCSFVLAALLSCSVCRSRSHWHNSVVGAYSVGHHGTRGGCPYVPVQHVPGSVVCTVWPAQRVPAVSPHPGPAGGRGPAACGCFPQSRCAPFIPPSLPVTKVCIGHCHCFQPPVTGSVVLIHYGTRAASVRHMYTRGRFDTWQKHCAGHN